MNYERIAGTFKLLANAKRLQILHILQERGSMSVTEINDEVDLSQSALSQHLAKLRAAGVVETHRQAQTIIYRVTARYLEIAYKGDMGL